MAARRENGCGAGGALFCALSFLKSSPPRFWDLRGARASFFAAPFAGVEASGSTSLVKMFVAPQHTRVVDAIQTQRWALVRLARSRTILRPLLASDSCCNGPLGTPQSRPSRVCRWQWSLGEAAQAIAFGRSATRRRAVSVSGFAFVLPLVARSKSETPRRVCAALPGKLARLPKRCCRPRASRSAATKA